MTTALLYPIFPWLVSRWEYLICPLHLHKSICPLTCLGKPGCSFSGPAEALVDLTSSYSSHFPILSLSYIITGIQLVIGCFLVGWCGGTQSWMWNKKDLKHKLPVPNLLPPPHPLYTLFLLAGSFHHWLWTYSQHPDILFSEVRWRWDACVLFSGARQHISKLTTISGMGVGVSVQQTPQKEKK